MYVSDSDNEEAINRRGNKIEDIDIEDISEHSSDDIDSDSDELVSPDQK
jgi:ribosome-associated protein YbcJ (S4-like RNA binding protein)